MKKINIIIFIFILITSTFLLGCERKSINGTQDTTLVIGVVTKFRDSEYWRSMISAMETTSKKLGVELITLSVDSETDSEIQYKLIRDLIKKKVDVIAVSSVDSYNNSYVDIATEHNIPVFTFDTPILDYDVPYIGVDNRKVGYNLAAYMAKEMNYKGNVGVIMGSLQQLSHKERLLGFQDYIKEHSNMDILFTNIGYSNVSLPQLELEEIYEEYPDIDGIMVTSAVTALGVIDLYENNDVVITTVDYQTDAIKAVKQGKIEALAAQSGYDIGVETINFIVDNKDKKSISNKILDCELITKDNVTDY